MRLPTKTSSFLISFTIIIFFTDVFAQSSCEDNIFANQVGYFPNAGKVAILTTSSAKSAQDWQLRNTGNQIVASGKTSVYGDDAASGMHLQHINFSEMVEPDNGFILQSGCAQSHPFSISEDVYASLKEDALIYFYVNRAGVPIESRFVGELHARPAGHVNELVTCRSGKDSRDNDWPGCDYSLNVTGGWYDAGDQGKYVVNGGISTWTLQNLVELMKLKGFSAFEDNAAGENPGRLPESSNGFNDLLDEARFEMEFMLSMQAPVGAKAQVPVGKQEQGKALSFSEIDASHMAHHKVADENWTALPTLPHLDKEKRVLFPVTTAATLNLVATAAQCARLWRDLDDEFSRRCLLAAERAYVAALKNPEIYFTAGGFSGSGAYGDNELGDEFFWAAAELFITTGKDIYEKAISSSSVITGEIKVQHSSWRETHALGKISLALVDNNLPQPELSKIRESILTTANRYVSEQDDVGFAIPYSSQKYFWGSNSDILNRALISAVAYLITDERKYLDPAVNTMDYLLGRNPLDQSYISGYGENPMVNPHHRAWAHSLDASVPPPPPGALSGGPNNGNGSDPVMVKLLEQQCAPQTCWRDEVEAYALNEVAINWNAPLVWVTTFLDSALRTTE